MTDDTKERLEQFCIFAEKTFPSLNFFSWRLYRLKKGAIDFETAVAIYAGASVERIDENKLPTTFIPRCCMEGRLLTIVELTQEFLGLEPKEYRTLSIVEEWPKEFYERVKLKMNIPTSLVVERFRHFIEYGK